jgi:Na+/proline symporter
MRPHMPSLHHFLHHCPLNDPDKIFSIGKRFPIRGLDIFLAVRQHCQRAVVCRTCILFAIIIAMFSPGIIPLLNFVLILNAGGILVPVVGGILWKRANLKAGLSAFFAGIIAAALGLSGVKFGIPTEIFGILVSFVVFIVVTLVTTKKGDQLLVE